MSATSRRHIQLVVPAPWRSTAVGAGAGRSTTVLDEVRQVVERLMQGHGVCVGVRVHLPVLQDVAVAVALRLR